MMKISDLPRLSGPVETPAIYELLPDSFVINNVEDLNTLYFFNQMAKFIMIIQVWPMSC